jgi:uncharacterized protein with HEPN domain
MWTVTTKVIAIITEPTAKISESIQKNTGKARHQETTENRHVGNCIHTWDGTNVKVQDVITGNNITCVAHCNQKTAGKLYTLNTSFASGI